MDDATSLPPHARLKQFQRFGEHGPVYEILGTAAKPDNVRVRVLKTGEEFDYRLADAKSDPPA